MSASGKDVYTVKVRCGNCGYAGDGVFKKGVAVRKAECPECECKEVMYSEPEQAASIG
jgi:ribosomal protein S27E